MKKLTSLSVLAFLLAPAVQAETSQTVHTESNLVKTDRGVERTSKTERVIDPEGLGNITWSQESVHAKLNNDGTATQQIDRKSVDQSGTARLINETVERSVQHDGTVETVTKKKIVTDPKGLMNRSESNSERTVKNHPDGRTTSSEKLNGNTVETTR